ncbi:uncharacterized protein MAM_05335 [Metarhizium album ARSEF 1941]|uniref:Uncharacterized protein n=1 Tax=Metarhizium album (strain ARSEF 1941) TaxID=1081103 RepID=A0A0B2WT50_METAS|nr:uncharacterized protein MAM_05335 [Metarhizium album ARSEF 1941]KHN96779.1 hypothetical protein MAM_05335 [Metarhizium album ARSEF 1941]
MFSSGSTLAPSHVGSVPSSTVHIPQPPTFCLSSPVHAYGFGQANQLQMNSFPFTQFHSMGQGVASNMYTGNPTCQEGANGNLSGLARQSAPKNIRTIPFCHPNLNFSFNSSYGQHVSNDESIPGYSYQHGPKGLFDHLGRNSATSNPWEFSSGMVHTSMDLLNSTPAFIGLNDTPVLDTQNYQPHSRLADHSPFVPISKMPQAPAISFQQINNQVLRRISPEGPAKPEPESCRRPRTGLAKDVLDNVTSKEYMERKHKDCIEDLSVHSTDADILDFSSCFPAPPQDSFNKALGIADPATSVSAPTAKTASLDELNVTEVSDRDRPTTASTVSTDETSVSRPREPTHTGKFRNKSRLENKRPGDGSTPGTTQAVLGICGEPGEK